ncbi:hypothetical protein CBF23_010550 [Marinomonas agarivorans]|nr:hypothetical protein CBF23_010550 [Marinomonas agarivorans]
MFLFDCECQKVLTKSLFCSFVFLCMSSGQVNSSPWLESSDPFLRSSLVLLSDTQQISSPVGTYPMRWALFGDDLSNLGAKNNLTDYPDLPSFVVLAKNELSYSLNTAKLNRGNKYFGVQAFSANLSKKHALLLNYGQFDDSEWQVYTGVDYLSNSFAYRMKLSYRDDGSREEVDWQDSYLSLNAGKWLFTVGQLEYWWGQGWLHNLILANYADPTLSLQASYINQNDILGVWSFQTLVLAPESSFYDRHAAARLSIKPWHSAELATTYQSWFSGLDESSDEQIALDAKLTLPSLIGIYHSVYSELASAANVSSIGAWMTGWTGSFALDQNTLRIVVETQRQSSEYQESDWHAGSYPSLSNSIANTSYQLDRSHAVALYIQRTNDHNIGISYQLADDEGDSIQAAMFTYRMPALSGLVNFSVSSIKDSSVGRERNHNNQWGVDYELRF